MSGGTVGSGEEEDIRMEQAKTYSGACFRKVH